MHDALRTENSAAARARFFTIRNRKRFPLVALASLAFLAIATLLLVTDDPMRSKRREREMLQLAGRLAELEMRSEAILTRYSPAIDLLKDWERDAAQILTVVDTDPSLNTSKSDGTQSRTSAEQSDDSLNHNEDEAQWVRSIRLQLTKNIQELREPKDPKGSYFRIRQKLSLWKLIHES